MGEVTIPEVDVYQALQLVDAGAVLMDVREDDEWLAGHAPTAVHVPLGSLSSLDLAAIEGRRVVLVCRSGNRSRGATEFLLGRGVDAVNLIGGMKAWKLAGAPVITASDADGEII
jgi:rhodanese-related sulfurtransferase